MSSKHSEYFPLRWNSGVTETLSKDSEEAFHRGFTDEIQVLGSNQVWVGGFVRVDSRDTSNEVCYVQIYTRESGSDSVDMLFESMVLDSFSRQDSYCHNSRSLPRLRFYHRESCYPDFKQ